MEDADRETADAGVGGAGGRCPGGLGAWSGHEEGDPGGCFSALLTLLGLLLGAAAVLLLFRADLFDSHEGESGAPEPSVSSSSSTTTVTSATGTVTLGPGQSMLDEGELRKAVESLTQGADKRQALTVVVQDRLLAVVFSPPA